MSEKQSPHVRQLAGMCDKLREHVVLQARRHRLHPAKLRSCGQQRGRHFADEGIRVRNFRERLRIIGGIDDAHAPGGGLDFFETGGINSRVNDEFHRTFCRVRLFHFTFECAYSTTLHNPTQGTVCSCSNNKQYNSFCAKRGRIFAACVPHDRRSYDNEETNAGSSRCATDHPQLWCWQMSAPWRNQKPRAFAGS